MSFETGILRCPMKGPFQNERIVFQSSCSRGELFVGLVWLISSYVCPAECWEFSNFLGCKLKFSITKYVIPEALNLFPPIFERRYISGIYESMSNAGVSTFPGSTQAWGSTYHPPTPRRPRGTPIGGGTVAQRWCDRSIASSTCWLSM